MKIKSYKELDVWKKGIEIVDVVYKMTGKFPKEERYGLTTQMQRAAVSIASNIAEGFARQHTKEYQQFCYIALGSCAELETQLIIAQRRNYVSSEAFSELEDYLDHESRMLMNLIKSLRG
jgi:four helix bundle protein